jgi:general secretion pathway protein C
MTAIPRRPDSGRLVETACWLLAAVCVLLALRVAVTLIDGVNVDFETIPVPEMDTSPPVPEGADWRLFGQPGEPDYGFRQPLPATPLALRLRGVVTGDRGYAIIVDAQGDEDVYRIGDEVPGEATVVTIQARRVVLERDGTREALELPGSGGAATAAAAPASGRDDAGNGLAAGVGIGSLGSMTSRFGLDADALARRITIIPVKGGGFRVRAGRDAPLFKQLGLHANDVVLAVNGRPVDNEADVRAVFGDYRPGEALAITVRRGDRQLVLTPDLSIPGGAERP